MSFTVVIPAAGSGTRMGAALPKVLLPLEAGGSLSILERVVSCFDRHPDCSRIVVCAHPDWRGRFEELLCKFSRLSLVNGGATRQESVRLAIEHLASLGKADLEGVVLVHDAARCCVSAAVIDRVLAGVREFGAATAGVKVIDALCRVDHDGRLVDHVDRSALWSVQTPQGFRLGDLLAAHTRAREGGVSALDDAELVRALREVRIVEGDRRNIKVTEPGDIKLAGVFSDG
jgi:2-C-methyl-D-erythritol 4-phosphate cytidylyltransferase